MRLLTYTASSLRHYWRTHLGVFLATSLCAAVLTGALLTNGSIGETLADIGSQRLGSVEFSLSTADRMLSEGSAAALRSALGRETAGLLLLRGAVSGPAGPQVNSQIVGADSAFFALSPSGRPLTPPESGKVYVGRKLADSLQAGVGEEVIFRIHLPEAMPVDAPLSGSGNLSVLFRARISRILEDDDFAIFSLETSQILRSNAFFDRSYLARSLDLEGRINAVLVGAGKEGQSDVLTAGEVDKAFRSIFTAADAGLYTRAIPGGIEVLSTRVFIDPPIEESARLFGALPVLTYFVDSIVADPAGGSGRRIPYSFVAAVDNPHITAGLKDDSIVLNRWAADDLKVKPGDTVYLRYRVLASGSGLAETQTPFTLEKVVDIEEAHASFMPEYPGVHGAADCADWDPGFDIDLEAIRDRDEVYWDLYGGSPKAFVTYRAGAGMWGNRYGRATALRLDSPESLLRSIDPRSLGFRFAAVREENETAVSGGVDFSSLFLALSMFLVASAVLLSALFFSLSFRQRRTELGILSAAGWPDGKIAAVLMLEHTVVALTGGAAGLILGIFYNRLILLGLQTIWNDAVRLEAIKQRVTFPAVAAGLLASLASASAVFFFGVRRALKAQVVRLLSTEASSLRFDGSGRRRRGVKIKVAGWTGIAAAVAATAAGALGGGVFQVISFFISGTLFLIFGMVFFSIWMGSFGSRSGGKLTLVRLGVLIAARRRLKSLNVAVLFAVGIFIVTAVGANRGGVPADPADKSSGTGGFLLIGESATPVKSVSPDIDAVGFKVVDGDDASCLNLTKARSPRILGVDPSKLEGRFSFVSPARYDGADPWSLLRSETGDGTIPAIADQTVLTWGLGLEVGDPLTYSAERGGEIKLRIAAGLKNSIFQGNIIVAEERLIEYFPSVSGKRFFLVDAPGADPAAYSKELTRRMGPLGLSFVSSADRLAEFSSVQNTYLAIFTMLGGLGILLGALGLGIAAARSIFESRGEYGLLIAQGYTLAEIRKVIIIEHIVPLAAGTVIGFISAIVAVLPPVIVNGSIQIGYIGSAAAIILLSGIASITVFTSRLSSRPLIKALRGE